ncbi:MAG: hypothetical protein E7099_06650 [Mediterranea massiliensis]|nr:hypothetical protein [Mediterranea massiliensis]
MKKINCFLKCIILTFVGVIIASCCQTESKNSFPTNKKEIMDAFVAGTLDKSYVPAAFFIHFPGSNSKVGEGAVKSHLNYLLQTNADILKVQFEQRPDYIKGLDKQETWDNIAEMPEDFYRPTFEVVEQLQKYVGKDVYILPTIYSPYQVARQSLGDDNIAKAAVERPSDLKRVLGYYAKALEWYVNACKEIGIEGFYMTTQGGEMKYYHIPGFFEEQIKPFDLQIMNLCQKDSKITILHICDWEGTYDDLTRYLDYPGDIVNTPLILNGTPFSISDGEKLFNRPVLGGLDRKKEIIFGNTNDVATAVRKAIANGPKGRTMIGAECTVSDAPIENIHTAIYTAHHADIE